MPQWIDKNAELASKFINSTNLHVFLTGRAGTGKTTFLHDIRQRTHKSAIVAAPTGIAAINAGGVTLHSLFQLPFGAFIPAELSPGENPPGFEFNTPGLLQRNLKMHSAKRNLLKKLELLIIDEVSMLRADLLDAIDAVLRRVRKKRHLPFGGVQILFIGDMHQLPPVVKDAEWRIMQQYYPTMFFFGARALQENQPVYIELEHIYRQTDGHFISVLNNLRDNRVTQKDIDLLNRCCKPGFTAGPDDGYVYLTTHNYKVDRINREELGKLPGREFLYSAYINGTFDVHIYPADPELVLKKDAQVMFIKNDPSGEQRFFNGKIGKVETLEENAVKVCFPDGSPAVWVESCTWENKRYVLNNKTGEIEEKVTGTFAQFPLKPAWAITVHKSQGLTFDKAIIDVSRAFAAGQVYVALSRLTAMDGLVLTSAFNWQPMAHESALTEFIRQNKKSGFSHDLLQNAAFAYLGREIKDAFNFHDLWGDLQFHLQSYNKAATHSKKQAYIEWARELQADFKPVKDVGDKFLQQLDRVLQSVQNNDFAYVKERVEAAKNYFEPLLNRFSERIRDHAGGLKKEKTGVKQYIRELSELEMLFYGRLQKMYKAPAIIDAFRNEKELTKEQVDTPPQNRPDAFGKKAGKHLKPGPKTKKATKTDTRVLSLQMYNQGKTIDEIAAARALSPRTIENHIAGWIQHGELDVYMLVGKNSVDEITTAIEMLDTEYLKPVYEHFAGKYTYPAIKFAAAHLEKEKQSRKI